jgi:carbon starvation protein
LGVTVVLLIIGSLSFFFVIGYRMYGNFIDRKLVKPDPNFITPAHFHEGDPDYALARPPVLFGHHFASIAGAGPIIGPVIALANFGWIAVFGWILLGSVFIGAVHDYLALILSVRNDCESIVQIAGKTMGARSRAIFGLFLFITLVLVIAVFGITGAVTMVNQPSMVIPTFMIIIISLFFGKAVSHRKAPLVPATIVAVSLNLAFIVIGYFVPIDIVTLFGISKANAQVFWFTVLMIYAGVASILPVEILLQPRDYISTFNLYGALGLGLTGLLVMHPTINAPAYIDFHSGKGPLWPMLFVLVACGAVSGFHSLVSGGTTSKQLANETHARPIAFGGMILEGVLAMMTLFLVACAFHWEITEIGGEEALVFYDSYEKGWVVVFGQAFGKIVSDMLPFIGFGIASLVGMITIKTFILTTLDSATRITRFLIEETIGKKVPLLSNKYVALTAALAPAYALGITNSWKTIWPLFGASNQLVAAFALFVVSAYLIGVRRPTRYTVIPAIFMLVTTMGALGWQAKQFLLSDKPNFTLGITSLFILGLSFFLAYEGVRMFLRPKTEPAGNE